MINFVGIFEVNNFLGICVAINFVGIHMAINFAEIYEGLFCRNFASQKISRD